MKNNSLPFVGIMMASLIVVSLAGGQCPVGGCGSGDSSWQESAQAFISSDVPIVGLKQNQNLSREASRQASQLAELLNQHQNTMFQKSVRTMFSLYPE